MSQRRILLYDPSLIAKNHSRDFRFEGRRARRRWRDSFSMRLLFMSEIVREVVFCECWWLRCLDDCGIYTFLKGGLRIERSQTRNATRNLCHPRKSGWFEFVVEISRIAKIGKVWCIWWLKATIYGNRLILEISTTHSKSRTIPNMTEVACRIALLAAVNV